MTVTPHEGPGWGTLTVTGTGAARRLRASLPVGWLADVWACGLAVAGGYLVVGVDEPGYPLARVQALVRARRRAGRDHGPRGYTDLRAALPAWEVAAD